MNSSKSILPFPFMSALVMREEGEERREERRKKRRR
jgi:hypothetical protein